MEILIISLLSLIISGGLGVALSLQMIKDISDQNYKINFNLKPNASTKPNTSSHKKSSISNKALLCAITPGVNLTLILISIIKYYQSRSTILEALRIEEEIIPFSLEEENQYRKNPTISTAFKMMYKPQTDKDVITVSFSNNEEQNYISYIINENGHKIITKSEGPVSKLSIIEQRALIQDYENGYTNNISNIFYSNKDTDNNEMPRIGPISNNEQKEILQDMKKELLFMEEEQKKEEEISLKLKK